MLWMQIAIGQCTSLGARCLDRYLQSISRWGGIDLHNWNA